MSDVVRGFDRVGRGTWTLTLKPGEADGIYHKRSAWQLVTLPDDLEAACQDTYLRAAEKPPAGFEPVELPSYALAVQATRDV